MKNTMDYVRKKADSGMEFGEIFCRVTGWLESEAEHDPNDTCTVKEVSDLFNLLFEIRLGRYKVETPAVDAAGESRSNK